MEATRPAGPDDVDRIVELARQARAEVRDGRGGAVLVAHELRAEPLAPALRTLLDEPGAAVQVGTIDGAVLGYGIATVVELGAGERLGRIEELYVEPEARQVGVGEAVVEALVAFCRGRGCLGVDALALPGLRATKNFFEEMGFSARLLVMHRRDP